MTRLSSRTFTDFRIRTKLAIGFGAVFLVAFTVAGIGANSVLTVRDSADTAIEQGERVNAIALEVQGHMARAESAALAAALRDGSGAVMPAEAARSTIAYELGAARALLSEAERLAPTDRTPLSFIASQLDTVERAYGEVAAARDTRGDGLSGKRGEFLSHQRAVEDLVGLRSGGDRLTAATLVARRNAEEYFATGDTKAAARTSTALTVLDNEADGAAALRPDEKATLKADIKAAATAFSAVVAADKSLATAEASFRGATYAANRTATEISASGLAAAKAARADIGETTDYATTMITLVTVVGLLMAALFVIVLSRTITRPLGSLADVANRMSLGELDVAIGVEGNDEVGQLAESLRRMQASLRAAIERLRARRAA